jgi:hypothetical protein
LCVFFFFFKKNSFFLHTLTFLNSHHTPSVTPTSTSRFTSPANAMASTEPALSRLDPAGRVTRLGLNMYLKERKKRSKGSKKSSGGEGGAGPSATAAAAAQPAAPTTYIASVEQSRQASAGVDALAGLMGISTSAEPGAECVCCVLQFFFFLFFSSYFF